VCVAFVFFVWDGWVVCGGCVVCVLCLVFVWCVFGLCDVCVFLFGKFLWCLRYVCGV